MTLVQSPAVARPLTGSQSSSGETVEGLEWPLPLSVTRRASLPTPDQRRRPTPAPCSAPVPSVAAQRAVERLVQIEDRTRAIVTRQHDSRALDEHPRSFQTEVEVGLTRSGLQRK